MIADWVSSNIVGILVPIVTLIIGVYKDMILSFLKIKKDNQVTDIDLAQKALKMVDDSMLTVNTLQEQLKNNNEMINALELQVNKAKQESVELLENLNNISTQLELLRFKQEKIRELCSCGAFDIVEKELKDE